MLLQFVCVCACCKDHNHYFDKNHIIPIVNIILVQIVPCNTVFGSPHTMVSLYTFFQFTKLFLTVQYLSHHSLKLRLTVAVILPYHLFRTLQPLRDFSMMTSPVARLHFFLLHMLVSCSVSDWLAKLHVLQSNLHVQPSLVSNHLP